ncbi:MAG TPA: Gfo/Idh/MocA family oxidoreductase, partial [Anseongella sp.]|nr:Gfo/Idh/MocA family oxidoreductase [Anseongella sp.]
MYDPNYPSRREFVRHVSFGFGTAMLGFSGIAGASGKVLDHLEDPVPEALPRDMQDRKLGIALVGLGAYATGQLAPALQETKHCRLAGIVTGTPEKALEWKARYNIPDKNIYNYENYDTIRDNEEIDIIYIVLPNSMHAEYTIRGARAGKHMISEKPMATSVEDCQRMIDACREAGRRLSIGYRLHFEPHNQHMMKLGREKAYGSLRKMEASNSFVMGNTPRAWRLDKKLAGGGPLMDLGIYCVQGALYTMGEEPIAVNARFGEVTKPELFSQVEQTIDWQMEFPGGVMAHCTTSYAESENLLRAEAEKGWFELSPAYAYGGIKGRTSEGKMDFPGI